MVRKKLTVEERDRLLQKAGKEYAVTYMLMTIAIDHADEGDRAVAELGLNRNEIKMNAERVQKAFDVFCRDFRKYIAHGDDKVILNDYERLTAAIEQVVDSNL